MSDTPRRNVSNLRGNAAAPTKARSTAAWVLAAALGVSGCSGSIAGDASRGGGGAGGSNTGGGGATTGTGSGNGGADQPGVPVDPTKPMTSGTVSPFTCAGPGSAASAPRLVRLTAPQYKNALAAAYSGRAATGRAAAAGVEIGPTVPFSAIQQSDRYSTLATSYTMNDIEFRQVLDAATDNGERLVTQLKKTNPCLGTAGAGWADCLDKVVADRGAILFSRPLTTQERGVFKQLGTAQVAALGPDGAAALVMESLLMAPQFLFRSEWGEGAADARGRVRLSSHEVASSLSYTLTDQPPDEALWQAAEAKALQSPEQIRTHVERLLGKLDTNEPLRRFFREYLKYERATTIFKDAKEVPFHKAEDLVADTELFLQDLLATQGRQGFLNALFTSTVGFVRASTAPNYNLTGITDTAPKKVTLPAEHRAGIITQPGFLTAWSEAEKTDVIRRGRFIRESFLCGTVPQLPIGLVPVLPDLGPDATQRDRLALHSAGDCARCHTLMDPIGLGLEGYDHVGRRREIESKKPVNEEGELTGAGPSDGKFKGGVELARRLADSPVVARCFASQSFLFWMGREGSAVSDGCALGAAAKALEEKGDLVGALTAFFTSEEFLYRTAAK